jgi:CheY-like chemotaxis protein
MHQITEMTRKKTSPGQSDLKRLDNVHVLLVEDSADIQLLLSHFLCTAGAKVATAINGQEAVEKALTNDFDLILMDLQMPVMDGYEAIKVLRERKYTRPVVALTAHAMKEERLRCLDMGFDEHLGKPVARETLLRTVSLYAQ